MLRPIRRVVTGHGALCHVAFILIDAVDGKERTRA